MSSNLGGITEADIADYLANTPGFFQRHAELLGSIQLTSPHGQRAVSLQERQMEMLRDKIKGLEMRIIEMLRHGQDNVALSDRLHRWTRALLATARPADVAAVLLAQLQHEFMIPQAALRVWGVADAFATLSIVNGGRSEDSGGGKDAGQGAASEDAKSLANSLATPYCGVNTGFEAVRWLDDPATVMSLALVPLRRGSEAFGLLVLASPDPTRYSADMGTEFLMRLGEVASASLSRLLPNPAQNSAPGTATVG